jgi:chromosome segregation ATPase
MRNYKPKKEKTINFFELERKNKQLLGKSNRLVKMIDRREKDLKPILKELRKLNEKISEKRNDINEIKRKLNLVKREITGLRELNQFDPQIIVTYSPIKNKNTGTNYSYWYGKIKFGDKERKIQISKRTERMVNKKLTEYLLKNDLVWTQVEKKNFLRNKFKEEVRKWWRDVGVYTTKKVKDERIIRDTK